MYEVFRKIRPGVPLLALYGKQKQLKRIGVYARFCKMQHALLFATDIAARGLGELFLSHHHQYILREGVNIYLELDLRSRYFFMASTFSTVHLKTCTSSYILCLEGLIGID